MMILLPVGFVLAVVHTAQAASVSHYWDFDTKVGGTPVDLAGGLVTTTVGTPDVSQSGTYGEAYPGAGESLNTLILGTSYLEADVFDGINATGMIFAGNFSMSYWSYDASDLDSDPRGPRVLDSLDFIESGIQIGTSEVGIFNVRLDDNNGNSVLSIDTLEELNQANGQWVHVVVNVDRDNDLAEIFFDGNSQGTFDISSLDGLIEPSQDMQIGVFNGSGNHRAQESGLDDLAFYEGVLSSAEIAGLASGALTPDLIPEPSSLAFGLLGVAGFLRRRR